MKPKINATETWLDISDAAQYLGVHFTTLRRWADEGQVAYIRTPGGRRRFSQKALEDLLHRLAALAPGTHAASPAALAPLQERAVGLARQSVQNLPAADSGWLDRMSSDQRLQMRGTGHRLTALLLQYNSRQEGGEAFLAEGRRITADYSQVCKQVGLSLPETVQVFLFFRRSILDAIHSTGHLCGSADPEGQRLFTRTTDFLDDLLLNLIHTFQNEQDPSSP